MIRKVVTYWNAAPGEEEPDTQAKVLALITRIESDLKSPGGLRRNDCCTMSPITFLQER